MLLPWSRTRVAGMPSYSLALLALISAVVEDVPQLVMQISYLVTFSDEYNAATEFATSDNATVVSRSLAPPCPRPRCAPRPCRRSSSHRS